MQSFGKTLVRVRRGPRANRSGRWVSIAVAATVGVLALPAASAGAATFTVNTVSDVTVGTCDAAHCTLREAITDANAAGGADTIAFNIPGVGPHTITPGSALPVVTGAVVIDGTTEPSFAGSPIVELNGMLTAPGSSGLNITAGNSTVRGLVINRFSPLANTGAAGIFLANGGGDLIEGNFIGTDVTGTLPLGNESGIVMRSAGNRVLGNVVSDNRGGNGAGIWSIAGSDVIQGNLIGTDLTGTQAIGNNFGVILASPSNLLGGTTAAARNVISGNIGGGIQICGGCVGNPAAATGNRVQGNYIGTDATGTGAVPNVNNLGAAVIVRSPSNLIGGTVPGAGNVISGNRRDGVLFGLTFGPPSATDNLLQGNLIGTAADGTSPLGNAGHGVVAGLFTGESLRNTVGGTAAGAGNTIAHNGGAGVFVGSASVQNSILRNAMFANGSLGIDLFPAGVTANDPGDLDGGGNDGQNFPVLTFAGAGGGVTLVEGTLNSEPNQTYRLEFFSSQACDPSGNGEGRTFLGTASVTTDALGNASFSETLSGAASPGDVATATATDPSGNTSEFSACRAVVSLVTGKVSARGTVTGSADANTRFSAANDCISPQSTRPFIVEWLTRRFTKTTVTSSRCFDDPAVTPSPAVPSGFDTQTGRANGVLENSQPATIEWTFVEGGAGASPLDRVQFTIRNGGGAVLLSVASQLPRPLGGTPGGVWTFAAPPPSA